MEITKIFLDDKRALAEADKLLAAEGIRRDANLDYLCGMYDDDYKLAAVGGAFANTLRCFAVAKEHKGEALLNTIVTHLIDRAAENGIFELFVYTKTNSAKFFQSLGFSEIARVENELVFMTNQRRAFRDYLAKFQAETAKFLNDHADIAAQIASGGKIAAIVMNANPFTLGHQHLVEIAAAENSLVHLFAVSEDISLVPFAVRRRLIEAGISHLNNVVLHDSGSFIISQATFPSYFQKDDEAVSRSHALLDIAVFAKIAAALGITRRYVGEEPFSEVTNIYNKIMAESLPAVGVEQRIVKRFECNGKAISASAVRELIKNGDFFGLKELVPPPTLEFFSSPAAQPVIEKIRAAENVVHH